MTDDTVTDLPDTDSESIDGGVIPWAAYGALLATIAAAESISQFTNGLFDGLLGG